MKLDQQTVVKYVHDTLQELGTKIELPIHSKYPKGTIFDYSTWLLIDDVTNHWGKSISVSVAPCIGGAYNYIGDIEITEDYIILKIKSVFNIMRMNKKEETYTYPIHLENSVTQMHNKLKEVAPIALYVINLEHQRSWKRWARQDRKRRAISS